MHWNRQLYAGRAESPIQQSQLWKPGTGDPLHTQEPVTVAAFRTWRGWRECIARDRCLTGLILASVCWPSCCTTNLRAGGSDTRKHKNHQPLRTRRYTKVHEEESFQVLCSFVGLGALR